MSVVFVIAVPVVAASWPVLSAAVLGAAAAMGYRALAAAEERAAASLLGEAGSRSRGVDLRMEDSQVMAESMARGASFTVEREGIRATFHRDGRGCCTVHVDGEGRSEAELQAAGQELMDRVRQQFAYARVMEELETRGFDVVAQEVEAEGSIRVRVRRWS